jgi:alpha,alpha-trehalose phosphorylase
VLTYCAPRHAEDALRWRASTLPQACAKAQRLGLRGAAFPWRTIAGDECSGYLPAGTAAFHVNGAIAHAAARHAAATGDERFEREVAAPLLVEIARMWASLGYHDDRRRGGRFSIDGVTGPDEYSPLVDNNLYTNLMAQANLRAAADAMTIPYDEQLGIHLQDEDFARHAPFDFAATPPEHHPLLLHVSYFQLYRQQVVKQPDLMLAMVLCGEAFTAEQKRRNLAYYEALTVRDSSLSAGTHAVLAAEVGDVQLAYDYLAEGDPARPPRQRPQHRRRAPPRRPRRRLDGRDQRAGRRPRARPPPCIRPRLPAGLERIAFRLAYRGRHLRVEITQEAATYELLTGPPLEIRHWDASLTTRSEAPASAPIPEPARIPALRQPPGRAPGRRRLSATGQLASRRHEQSS